MSSINSKIVKFVLTIFLCSNVKSFSIPSYHTTCKFSDPKFEQCAVTVANTVIENLRKGDTTLIDPKLKDIYLPHIELTDNGEVSINISDSHVRGYENLQILKIRKVSGKNRIETTSSIKEIKVTGDYSLDLVLDGKHITGKGKGLVSFNNVNYKANFEWKLTDKNGDKYVELTKIEEKPDIGDVVHNIDGVDNDVLNENWGEYVVKIVPAIDRYLLLVFHLFTDTIFKEIPYNKLFLE